MTRLTGVAALRYIRDHQVTPHIHAVRSDAGKKGIVAMRAVLKSRMEAQR
jgi:hypothetical protein